MDNQEMKKHIAAYKMLQEIPALKMPCPRCGKQQMNKNMAKNALSRHEDIYICTECGREESVFDYVGQKKPLELWYAVRFLNGEVLPYERKKPGNLKPYYKLSASVTFKVLDEDIDDIMCAALEGGINYWCNRVEVVGEKYFGKYASEQISRGGELLLYDCESDAVYTLTLDKLPHMSADAMTLRLTADELIPVRSMRREQTVLFSMQSSMALSTDSL